MGRSLLIYAENAYCMLFSLVTFETSETKFYLNNVRILRFSIFRSAIGFELQYSHLFSKKLVKMVTKSWVYFVTYH